MSNRFESIESGADGGVANNPFVLALIMGFNNDAQTTFYLQLFDANSLPIDGSSPVKTFVVGPQSNFSYAPSQSGRRFDPGLHWAVSTTALVLTIAPAAEFVVMLEGRTTG